MLAKEKKLKISIIVSFLVAILYIGLIIYPSVSNILNYNNKIYQQKKILYEQDLKEKNLKQYRNKEKEINYILSNTSKHLIIGDNVLNFILQLEEIAKNLNIKQEIKIEQSQEKEKAAPKKTEDETLTPQDAKIADPLKDQKNIPGQVVLASSFNELINYLINLEKAEIISDELILDTRLEGLSLLPANIPVTEEQKTAGDKLSTTLDFRIFLAE